MYILTGGAGFIGSAVLAKLNLMGIKDVIVVDSLQSSQKWRNLNGKNFSDFIHKDKFLSSKILHDPITAIIHMGACSSTTELDCDYLMENNFRYTKTLAEHAIKNCIRFIYASSAATYGDGFLGFEDTHETISKLRPINPYGFSKQMFDQWAFDSGAIDSVCGLKFFNVYGPNEYHKGAMQSVVVKTFKSIKETGKMNLFRSHHPDYKDGEQKRDFIYVKDCTEIIWNLLNKPSINGIYNVGSGTAKTWNDLVSAVFKALGLPERIEYIDMPVEIRNQYQYYTCAKVEKITAKLGEFSATPLEHGVTDYVQNYLNNDFSHL